MNQSIALIIAALAGIPPAFGAATHTPAASQQAPQQALWIDVRTPEEYNEGYLKGAVNTPYDQIAARINSTAPDKTTPINAYRRRARRSEIARQTLIKLGYTNVSNRGAYQDLLKHPPH